jgi:hypothetical protein
VLHGCSAKKLNHESHTDVLLSSSTICALSSYSQFSVQFLCMRIHFTEQDRNM